MWGSFSKAVAKSIGANLDAQPAHFTVVVNLGNDRSFTVRILCLSGLNDTFAVGECLAMYRDQVRISN